MFALQGLWIVDPSVFSDIATTHDKCEEEGKDKEEDKDKEEEGSFLFGSWYFSATEERDFCGVTHVDKRSTAQQQSLPPVPRRRWDRGDPEQGDVSTCMRSYVPLYPSPLAHDERVEVNFVRSVIEACIVRRQRGLCFDPLSHLQLADMPLALPSYTLDVPFAVSVGNRWPFLYHEQCGVIGLLSINAVQAEEETSFVAALLGFAYELVAKIGTVWTSLNGCLSWMDFFISTSLPFGIPDSNLCINEWLNLYGYFLSESFTETQIYTDAIEKWRRNEVNASHEGSKTHADSEQKIHLKVHDKDQKAPVVAHVHIHHVEYISNEQGATQDGTVRDHSMYCTGVITANIELLPHPHPTGELWHTDFSTVSTQLVICYPSSIRIESIVLHPSVISCVEEEFDHETMNSCKLPCNDTTHMEASGSTMLTRVASHFERYLKKEAETIPSSPPAHSSGSACFANDHHVTARNVHDTFRALKLISTARSGSVELVRYHAYLPEGGHQHVKTAKESTCAEAVTPVRGSFQMVRVAGKDANLPNPAHGQNRAWENIKHIPLPYNQIEQTYLLKVELHTQFAVTLDYVQAEEWRVDVDLGLETADVDVVSINHRAISHGVLVKSQDCSSHLASAMGPPLSASSFRWVIAPNVPTRAQMTLEVEVTLLSDDLTLKEVERNAVATLHMHILDQESIAGFSVVASRCRTGVSCQRSFSNGELDRIHANETSESRASTINTMRFEDEFSRIKVHKSSLKTDEWRRFALWNQQSTPRI